jgi:thiamine transport system ATP-binding protein
VLKIDALAFSYASKDRQAEPMLFDLQAKAGEIFSLIGPSGSGKSTLLGLIAGFNAASSGKILIDGEEIGHLTPAERPVTIVFQEHNLFPHLDVFTNIALGINPSLKLSQAQQAKIVQALDKLAIAELKKAMPGELSGGQKQRVAIARALVREHRILLLDEPFAALGPAQRKDMIELLKSIVRAQRMVALLVSHQPADALQASETTAFIYAGHVIAQQPTRKLLNESKLPEVNEYLGNLQATCGTFDA